MSQHRLCVEPSHQKGMRGGEQRIELVEDFVGLLALPTRGTVGYHEDGSRRPAARGHALHRGRLELRPMKADRPGNNDCEEKWVHLRILWARWCRRAGHRASATTLRRGS